MGRKPIIWTLELKKDSVGDLTDSLAKEGVPHKVANWCVRTHFMDNPDLKGTGHTSNNDGLPHLNKTLKALKGVMNAKVIPVYAGILIDILNVRCYSEKKCFFFKDGQIVAHDLVKGMPRVSLKEYKARLQKHLDHSKKHDGIILNDYNVTEECTESECRIRVERNVPAKVSSNNFQFTHTKINSSYSFVDVIPKRGRSSCAVDREVQGVSSFIQSFPEQYHSEVRKMLILALSYQTYADGKRYCFYEEDGEIKYHEQTPGVPYPSQKDIAKELDKLVEKSGKKGILLTGKATEKCEKKEKLPKITLELAKASTNGYLFESILTIGNEASIHRRKPDAIFSETSFPANTSLPKFFSNDKKKLKKYPYSVQKQVRETLQDYLNYFSYLSSGLRISYDSDFEYSIKQETTLSVAECKRLRERYKELTEASAKGKNGIQIYPTK